MLDFIKNNSLVLAPNNVKRRILKEISKSGKLLNLKFMTIEEFKDNYFGKPKKEAIYFLMKKYGLNYDVAREYLSNIFYDSDFLKPFYEDLKNNNLIEYNLIFKDSIKNVVCFYSVIDPLIGDILNDYNVTYVNHEKGVYLPKVYSFDSQTDEIIYITSDIVSKLETTDINDICLVISSDEYYDEIKRVFKWFNIPININNKKSIYGTDTCNLFLSILEDTYDVNKALESIEENDIYNKIVDVLNEYAWDTFDDVKISIIRNELRRSNIILPRYENAVNVISIEEMDDKKYYYLMGFNQGVIPRIYHDDKLIKDKDRKKIGLLTSSENLKGEKESIVNYITNTSNLTITYKNKDTYNSYFPSPLVKELGLEVIKNPENLLLYSNFYNKIHLSNLLDRYLKYNEVNGELWSLLKTYPNINYRKYDNSFKGIDKDKLYKYLNGKLNFSYSSLNNYFHCAFRYYINNILKLDPYEETFSIFLGNLFHACLSHMYDVDFDLKKEYLSFLNDKGLSFKEKFFTDKLYADLEFIIDTIRKHDSLSSLDSSCTEKYIGISKNGNLKIKFLGFVDKIKYKKENDKVICAIIDYKTGMIKTSLDNINYGFNLQLPVYIYLADKAFDKKVEVIGFYLQKLLPSLEIDKEVRDSSKLRLEGYSINDEKLLKMFDSSYEKSEVIKGMSITKNGFSYNSKVLSFEDISKIRNIVDKKIDEAIDGVQRANFVINPKRIDGKLVGCEFCKYKDLCFRKEEDIVDLKGMKLDEILKTQDFELNPVSWT